MMKWERITIF